MAISGVHIACGYVRIGDGGSLATNLAWSRTMTSPGVTDTVARLPIKKTPGDIVCALGFEVTPDRDIWFAFGASPDATQASGEESSARFHVRADETRNVFCTPGDRLAWAPA